MSEKEFKPTVILETPITESTFIAQGWERNEDNDGDTVFVYWTLPLPKDNPDEDAPSLISSADDEWDELGLPENTYVIEVFEMNGLGFSESEEEIEILYRALVGKGIYDDDKVSVQDDKVSDK